MIDLHLHLDGSLRPSTVRELLEKEGINWTIEEAVNNLRVSDKCENLEDYLKCFDYPLKVLQDAENITRCVFELAEDLYEQDVQYAEIRFAPILHLAKGLTMDEVVEAAIAGAKKAEKEFRDLRIGLILCCMRHCSEEDNMRTVEVAHKYLGEYVCALDLAGDEAHFPTENFINVFKKAKLYQIPFTIHAGEAAGPESIWRALEFGATRIGHGIRCIEDSTLVDYLARYEIPLEVCPISNMQTRVFSAQDTYPLKELLINGVCGTVNTDNRTVSNTTLEKEIEYIKTNCGIDDDDIDAMLAYSQKAKFLKD